MNKLSLSKKSQMTATDFRIACAKLDVSQRQMARYLEIHEQTVSHWARGRRNIPHQYAAAIEKLLSESEAEQGNTTT